MNQPDLFTAPTPTTYNFYNDPGHGWLEVPIEECKRLKVKPSGYSYVKNGFYYLEEDCDASLFLEAKSAAGEPFQHVSIYQERTPIRNYRRCSGTV